MALTGSLMFFFLETGIEAEGITQFVEEIHEIGEGLNSVLLHNFNRLTWCDWEQECVN